MLAVARRNRVATVAIAVANSAVAVVNDYFGMLTLGRFCGGTDRVLLGGMDGACTRRSLALRRLTFLMRNYVDISLLGHVSIS
jgi:hypothetical protein